MNIMDGEGARCRPVNTPSGTEQHVNVRMDDDWMTGCSGNGQWQVVRPIRVLLDRWKPVRPMFSPILLKQIMPTSTTT